MSKKVIFATGNAGKIKEAKEILGQLGLEVISQKEAGLAADVEENGGTFAANALIKARAIAAQCNDIVIADDSGLEVDYLNGEPGVYSARWMGEDTSYDIKNNKIIELLKEAKEEERTARFVCAIGCVLPDGSEIEGYGVMEGMIGHSQSGSNGFGYDPIFFLPEYGKTSADLSMEEKNKISHRGKALRNLCEKLKQRV